MAVIFQLPQVQTFVAKTAVERLSEHLDGEVYIESIHIKPFSNLIAKNILVIDKAPVSDPVDPSAPKIDTLAFVEMLSAQFSFTSLFKESCLQIDRVAIYNGHFNLVIEDNPEGEGRDTTQTNLQRIFKMKTSDPTYNDKDVFLIRDIDISNFTFQMKNYLEDRHIHDDGGIDWNDLYIHDAYFKAEDLHYNASIMSGIMKEGRFKEKTGFECRHLSGRTRVGRGCTIVEDLLLQDKWSDLNIRLYQMKYRNVKDFSDYINKVVMSGKIDSSILDFRTLEHFAPTLKGNELRASVSGEMTGTVADMKFWNIEAGLTNTTFRCKVSGRLTGIPDVDKMHLRGRVHQATISTEGLSKFVTEWMPEGSRLDLSEFAKGRNFNISASTDGYLNTLAVKADINSSIGALSGDVKFDNLIDNEKDIKLKGTANTTDLNIGEFIGTDLIGECSMRTGLKMQLGSGELGIGVDIDSLLVDKLNLNKYDYSGIAATGYLSKEIFDGKVICNDPNLNFLFQGTIAFSSKTKDALYQFYANIGHANLNAMNIDKRGVSEISLQTIANFRKTYEGNVLGKIDIGNLRLKNKFGTYNIGDINLTSHSTNNIYRMKLNSNFTVGSYVGSAPITTFVDDFLNLTLKREIPDLFTKPKYTFLNNEYKLNIIFNNSMDLMSFVLPGMYIADGTRLDAAIGKTGHINIDFSSPRIAFKEQYLKGINLKLNNNESTLRGNIHSDEIKVAGLSLNNSNFQAYVNDNHIGLGYSYDNGGEIANRGELYLKGYFDRPQPDSLEIDVEILPSSINFNSKEWHIHPSNIHVDKERINFDNVNISNGEEKISIFGNISQSQTDTLSLKLDRFNISLLNPLINYDFNFGGHLTGQANLFSPLGDIGLDINMLCDSTSIVGKQLGELHIDGLWDTDFHTFNFDVYNILNNKKNLDVNAKISPKNMAIESEIHMDSLQVGYIHPFLTDIFSEMEGYVSGDFTLNGPFQKLAVGSKDARLDGGRLKVGFTNVTYFADGTFHMDPTGGYFDDIKVRDSHNGTGSVSGRIYYDHFWDLGFDMQMKVNQIEGINLSRKQSEGFYGQVFGSGNVYLTGGLTNPKLTVDAITEKTGTLHIPITDFEGTTATTNLLKFTEEEKVVEIDPYEEMMSGLKAQEKANTNFTLDLNITASENVQAFIEIDDAGNTLSGRGNGNIRLSMDNENFNMNGDYTIRSGVYKFLALGLVSRDFEIKDGSSVKFAGDIMNTNLDIDAVYKTKASLSNLISDTTSVSNRRVVECGIKITETMMDPRLGFSINIPDLDPMIKSRVESALSTEDKIQKQFLSLLLSNNFLPDEQSGIVDNTSILYSNVSVIMSNQLNTILHKLNIPVDLGLNYQRNERGNDVFDVAISTQLFNNRVIVNGNIGNKQYNTNSSRSNIVGDLDIEIKLDKSGAVRLTVFSHSADVYTNFLDDSQRNGVGIVYQKEFNSLGQFFKKIFMSKKKRQEAKIKEEEELLNGKKVTIEVTADEDTSRNKSPKLKSAKQTDAKEKTGKIKTAKQTPAKQKPAKQKSAKQK